MFHLTYRPIQESDFEAVCNLPQNETELFYMFPKGTFPLTEQQLTDIVANRSDCTVFLKGNQIVAFANFYEVVPQNYCTLGNVIVSPLHRNQGIAKYLIQTMENIARKKHRCSQMYISCFGNNTQGLLLYSKLGYRPRDVEERHTSGGTRQALVKMRKTIGSPPKAEPSPIVAYWKQHRLRYNIALIVAGVLAFVSYCYVASMLIAQNLLTDFEVTLFSMLFQFIFYLTMLFIANMGYTLFMKFDEAIDKSNVDRITHKILFYGYFVVSCLVPFSITLLFYLSWK